ncbi:TRPM8 channel-associated factor homolog [Bombina bombina]|uniref:TRPM8 channel-associated factor homolog n=1 Tax=Bombina bombina TaxID=8345 RepID=UPI00235ADDC1|nr:TRPM8 channel-associated factor homolog [Bombina bombina]
MEAGFVDEKTSEFLIVDSPIKPVFNFLPKVHKSLIDVKGRPIISGIGSILEPMSQWLDSILQPMVSKLPSYLRDTKQLLIELESVVWQSQYSWLSIDVTSLYSSIPHDKGLEAIAFFLKRMTEYSSPFCSYILRSGEGFSSTITGERFRHFSCLNCRATYVVYLLTCVQCGVQYTGLTTRETRDRIREHVTNIKAGKLTTPLVQHFKMKHDKSTDTMRWTIIEQEMAGNVPTVQVYYKALVDGIKSLDFENIIPCTLQLLTEKAFALLVNSAGKTLIAASQHGSGRVIVLPNKECLNIPSFQPFFQNAVSWLKPPSVPEVGVQSSFASLAEFLTSKGHKVQTSDTINESYGVYCTHADDQSQTKDLVDFIKHGGGLLIAGQPDTSSSDVFNSYPGNKVAGVAGIYFSNSYSTAGSYPVTENLPYPLLDVNVSELSSHVKSLLNNVSSIDVDKMISPSAILAHGSHAFTVCQNDNFETVIAGALYGRGRVLVIGHEVLLNYPKNQAFLLNVLSWLDGGKNGEVGIYSNLYHLRDYLISINRTDISTRITGLYPSLSVFCCDSYTEYDNEDEILEFVAEGGGLLIGGHAWWWASQNPTKNAMTDYPGNKLLNKIGISILKHCICTKTFPVMNSDIFSTYYHFQSFLMQLQNFIRKVDLNITLSKDQISWTPTLYKHFKSFLRLSSQNIISIQSIFESIQQMFSSYEAPTPTKEKPLMKSSKDGCLIHLLSLLYEYYATKDELKLACLEKFPITPGSLVENAIIDGNNTDSKNLVWKSTGFYLPAKSSATFSFPGRVTNQSLKILIGCHSDNLLKCNSYSRAPVVTLLVPVTDETIRVASLYGGLVYIILPKRASLGQFSVTMQGVQRAPFFRKGQTSLSDWCDTIRHYPAPWAEMAADSLILTVPSHVASPVDNPEELLQLWEQAMAKVAELAAIPSFPRPERVVADVQISLGFMHSGYPIMIHLSSAPDLMNLSELKKNGSWGIIHELGHNQQQNGWNWYPYTGETTNNLWSVYVHEKLFNIPRSKAHCSLEPLAREKRMKMYMDRGAQIKDWSVWVALETYLQLQEAFGWEPFIQLFGDYQKIKDIQNDMEYKMNLWAELFSQKVNKNLAPFFTTWGWTIKPAVSDKLSALPEWAENPVKKYEKK